MKIVSWNIYNGGKDDPDKVPARRSVGGAPRLSIILEFLKTSHADLVFLQEANHFEANGTERLNEFSRVLDMHGYIAVAASGFHVAGLARRGIDATAVLTSGNGPYHARLDLSIESKTNDEMYVVSTHLLPFSGDSRLQAAHELSLLARRKTPVLVIGDLNAVDDVGDDATIAARMPQPHRERHLLPGDVVDRRAIAALKQSGFIDLHRYTNGGRSTPTVPTRLHKPDEQELPAITLDYAFGNAAILPHVRHVTVMKNRATDIASDHYPLVVELDFP